MLNIHAAAAAGELAVLHGIDHAARSAQLCRIWGIGPWSCDMLAIFYCREPDIWPEGDLAVQRVFRRYIGRRSPAKAAAASRPIVRCWRFTCGGSSPRSRNDRGGARPPGFAVWQ